MNRTADSAALGNPALGAPRHTALRGLARRLRYLPQRLLHPLRRRSARRRIATRLWPGSVLFVCHGNICRSPYAECAYRASLPDALRDRIKVSSAGFIGPDRPSPSTAQAVASRRGVNLSGHLSQLLNREDVQSAELVVVMDNRQRAAILETFDVTDDRVLVLGDLDPLPIARRAIEDPVGKSSETFEAVYARIDRCLESLVEAQRSAAPHLPSP